jgi:hypothetical protein
LVAEARSDSICSWRRQRPLMERDPRLREMVVSMELERK